MNIKDLALEINNNILSDMDYHINIVGNNGSGKSSIAITLAHYLKGFLNKDIQLIFDEKDFYENLEKRNTIFIYDEAEVLFGIRESFMKVGKRVNYLKLTRYYQNIHIFNSITPKKLFIELREEKIKMIIHAFYRDNKKIIASVFSIPPLLPIHYFHDQLEVIFSIPYNDEKEYGEIVENAKYFKGYLEFRKQEAIGYEEYYRIKDERVSRYVKDYKEKNLKRLENKPEVSLI